MMQTVYVSASPDTNGLPYLVPTPVVPPSMSAYLPPLQPQPPRLNLSSLARAAFVMGCLGNDALDPRSGSGASSDVPEGHMNGKRNANTSNGTSLNPSGSSAQTADTLTNGANVVNSTGGCLSTVR
jgi:hypothetical protein